MGSKPLPGGNKPLLSQRVNPRRSRPFVTIPVEGFGAGKARGGGAFAPLLLAYVLCSVCFVCCCN